MAFLGDYLAYHRLLVPNKISIAKVNRGEEKHTWMWYAKRVLRWLITDSCVSGLIYIEQLWKDYYFRSARCRSREECNACALVRLNRIFPYNLIGKISNLRRLILRNILIGLQLHIKNRITWVALSILIYISDMQNLIYIAVHILPNVNIVIRKIISPRLRKPCY